MANQRNYKYVIELTAPIWPRKLVDDLSATRDIFPNLVSVTDLQTDGHSYGATYVLDHGAVQRGGADDVRHPL